MNWDFCVPDSPIPLLWAVLIPLPRRGVRRTGWSVGVVKTQPMEILTTINGIAIKRNFVEHLPYNPKLKILAKEKRKAGILSEVLFWKQVRAKEFYKIDFDRQRIIGNYIVDFYVKALGLVVEIDGISHENKVEYDAARQVFLESWGLKVFRATDGEVKADIVSVMERLENFIITAYGINHHA